MEICLRTWRLADAADLAAGLNNKNVLNNLRDGLPFPYTEQAAREYITAMLAAERFPGGRILVMATNVTLREEKFARLMQRFSDTHEIGKVPCPGLVELIEQGCLRGAQILGLLHGYLDPWLDRRVDAVVLGCTHYPFAREAIRQVVGPEVCILDGGEGTARETRRRLLEAGLLAQTGAGSVELQNSLDSPQMLERARWLLDLKEI